MKNTKDFMRLVKLLKEGGMMSHRLIKRHVDYALRTGDKSRLYEFLEANPIYIAMAQRNIEQAEYNKLNNPFPYPEPDDAQEYLSGPLNLGYVNPQHDMFGVDYNVFCLPVIVPGRVGSGKSQFIKYCLIQILRKSRRFKVIIPDLKGKEYRNLLAYCKNLKVLTNNEIKLNPLQAPNWMSIMEYVLFFSKVFTRENYLLTTSESIIIELLEHIYKKRGIFDGSNNWPNFRDLYNVVSNRLDTEKSFRYRDVYLLLKNRLETYIRLGPFNCLQGIPDDVWRTQNIVLELGKGFTDNMYSYLVSHIAGLNSTYNIDHGLVGAKLRTLLIVDEGRILFKPRDQTVFGDSYINELSTRFRDPGIGMILSSQETSSFNQTIRSISFTKVCFPLTDGDDVSFIKQSFGLSKQQTDHLFKLPRFGQAVVRYGGYENPFLLAVPHLNLKKVITDEVVQKRMAEFYADLNAKMKDVKIPMFAHQQPQAIPPQAASLLYFLSNEPFTKISKMTNAPGFKSPAEVGKMLEWLEKAGLVRREQHRVSKRGRKSVFAVLTPKAYEYLGKKQIVGKGDFEHKLYQFLICRKLENDGLQTKIEGRISGFGKLIDVLARSKDGQYVAYEVTLHFENIISNIRQDLESGASKVFIVARDRESMQRAQKAVNANPEFGDHVEFVTIDQFFD
jgi:hypothetical protein